MSTLWSNFWWKNITGANYIVKEVVETLIANKAAILNVPYDLPWRHDMRAEVENTYKPNAESSYVIIDQIDDSDDRSEEVSVGTFLLRRNGQKREIINGYRDRAGKSIQEYLIENGVLKDRIIWVKGLTSERAKEWISFVEQYRSKAAKDGLFVLEVPGDIKNTSYDNIHVIKYSDYVTDYDVQLLNSFILSERDDLSEEWKQYISNVAAKLCGTDAEVSEWLINNTNLKKMNPIAAIGRMSVQPDFDMRGKADNSEHVLALHRADNTKELERRIWSSQIRTLFPIVELEKQRIVSENYESIKKTLASHEYKQYEKTIIDPYDLEIGSLYNLTTHRSPSGGYMLYIPDEELRDRISFLRDCRNKLAHSRCCTADEVNKLLSYR